MPKQAGNRIAGADPLYLLPHALPEITGPVYDYERVVPLDDDPTPQHEGEPLGEPIVAHGRVLDGGGPTVRGSLVEVRQANRHPEDRRDDLPLDPDFTDFGRCRTDAESRYEFLTVRQGVVPGPDGQPQAPHINVSVFARDPLRQLVIPVYFPDEEAANATDPVLEFIEDHHLRSSLIARQPDGALEFGIHLQGERQTAFFDV